MKPALIALALLAVPAAAAEDPPKDQHLLALAAGYKAAFLCSGRWNAGRDEASITRDDLTGIYPNIQPLVHGLPAVIDEAARTVSVKFNDNMPPRIAFWRPLLGCTQLPPGASTALIANVPRLAPGFASPNMAAMDAKPWPLGDVGAVQPLKKRKDQAALDAVVATAFTNDKTTAVIVLKDGKIVAERYRADWSMHTPQRVWSVGKSLTSTMVGRAVQKGLVDVDKPAPVPQWQAPGDPRAAITWNHLLRMQSGLWMAEPGDNTYEVYMGGALVTQTPATMPLDHMPGSHFNYSNSDFMLAALALSTTAARDGGRQAALAFPFTQLLWPLGMTRTTPETDWLGDFVMVGQVWMTARDLARFALLYQNGGKSSLGPSGEQILPPDWPAYVEHAGVAQPEPGTRFAGNSYGAGFFRRSGQGAHDNVPAFPAGAISMAGTRGQSAFVMPEQKIIVIRLGFDPIETPFRAQRFAAEVVAILP